MPGTDGSVLLEIEIVSLALRGKNEQYELLFFIDELNMSYAPHGLYARESE